MVSHHLKPRLSALVLASATLLLASCAGRGETQVASTGARSDGTVGASSSRMIWRLRSGLNVAALSCRGGSRAAVAPAYRRMLARHQRVFASSYRTEVSRYGMAGFDHDQTRVYNHFANQRSPQTFCSTAARVAQQAGSIDSASLPPAAPKLLAQLERGLR